MTRSCVNRTAMRDSESHSKHPLKKNIYPVTLASFLFIDEKILTLAALKKTTDWLTECICSSQDKRRCDKTPAHNINVHSLMASVGQPQLVDSTPVWYLSITKSRLTRLIVVTWCCYDSFCLLYTRSQASSSSFSTTVPRCTQRLGSQLSFLWLRQTLSDFKNSFKAD